jgi:hypothetical protein
LHHGHKDVQVLQPDPPSNLIAYLHRTTHVSSL